MNDQGTQPRQPQSQRGPAELPPLEQPGSRINWDACADETSERMDQPHAPLRADLRIECAHVFGVLDSPDAPGRGVSRIGLLKAGHGKTPLVVLNDVNGVPGTLYAAQLASILPPEMLSKFSLIGVDRRGTGDSDAARCIPGPAREQLVNIDPAANDVEPVVDAAREAGKECSIELETQFGALDSERTVADLETVRKALGIRHLNAIARGEGSRVLSLYATRHPDNAGRLVLDGAPDPSRDDLAATEETAAGAQAAYRDFATECTSGDCPLGPDPEQALSELVDRLRDRPLNTASGTTLGPGAALSAVLNGLADRPRWRELATAIAKARTGDGAELARFVEPMLKSTATKPARLDGALVTSCNDSMSRLSPDRINKTARDWRGKYPLFGGLIAQRLAWCSPWSRRTAPLPSPKGNGLPPVLVVSTRADPVTPERGTSRAAQNLSTAVRISWQGAGHGGVGQSECVTEAVTNFLIDGNVPHDDTPCPA
ncbi:MAG: alpha/beta fold hydrolase [Pseudonocardiaceae bacterium]|nr:alpha/beta fold hydrolase [Pseudonocardiaceae bacterium]